MLSLWQYSKKYGMVCQMDTINLNRISKLSQVLYNQLGSFVTCELKGHV